MTTEAIMELGREFPSLLEPLIYERDRYMVRRAAGCAHALPDVAAAWLIWRLNGH